MTAAVVQANIEAYRQQELIAEQSHEYCNGAIVPMTGGTYEHDTIIVNLLVALKLALRGTDYQVHSGDLRIWLPAVQVATYPDVSITLGQPDFTLGRRDEMLNPVLICEVLSRSTEGYDRGDKFSYYRTAETLTDYLLVGQYRPVITHYRKQNDGAWLMREYVSLDAVTPLLNTEIGLADVYDSVEFVGAD